MSNEKETKKSGLREFISKNLLALTLQLVGILVLIANLWLANQLTPYSDKLNLFAGRVSALENTSVHYVSRSEINEKFNGVNSRLDSVDSSLNTLQSNTTDIYKILINQ